MSDPTHHVCEVYGGAGGASSMHVHRHKVNLFIVTSGRLEVHYMDGRVESIEPGYDPIRVLADVYHRMVFPVDCVALEIYTPAAREDIVLASDIIRSDSGRDAYNAVPFPHGRNLQIA